MEINKKRFTISVAKKLLYMLEGKTLPSSSLPRWIVDELRIEGLITGITNGSRVSYRLTDTVAFGRYISDNYTSGTSLERWIEIFSGENKDLQRSMLVQETGDSKTVKLRTFRGFLVNCYEPVHARIGNSEFIISPPEGSAVFIQKPDEFHIPSDVTVVGVENGENFCRIRSQKHLFGDNKVLFVSPSRQIYGNGLLRFLIDIYILEILIWQVYVYISQSFINFWATERVSLFPKILKKG